MGVLIWDTRRVRLSWVRVPCAAAATPRCSIYTRHPGLGRVKGASGPASPGRHSKGVEGLTKARVGKQPGRRKTKEDEQVESGGDDEIMGPFVLYKTCVWLYEERYTFYSGLCGRGGSSIGHGTTGSRLPEKQM